MHTYAFSSSLRSPLGHSSFCLCFLCRLSCRNLFFHCKYEPLNDVDMKVGDDVTQSGVLRYLICVDYKNQLLVLTTRGRQQCRRTGFEFVQFDIESDIVIDPSPTCKESVIRRSSFCYFFELTRGGAWLRSGHSGR